MFFTSYGDLAIAQVADQFSPTRIQVGMADEQNFRAAPIEPTWVLEGNPVARSMPIAVSADGNFTCGRWDCTAGRFNFTYFCDEIIQILEGSVTIEEAGQRRTLKAGDVAFFPQGLTATWTVHGYVKKFAIFRSHSRSLPRRIASRVKRMVMRVLGQ